MVSSRAWSRVCIGGQERPQESITACGGPAPPAGRGATCCPVAEQGSAETAPDIAIRCGSWSSALCLSSRVAAVTPVETPEALDRLDYTGLKPKTPWIHRADQCGLSGFFFITTTDLAGEPFQMNC